MRDFVVIFLIVRTFASACTGGWKLHGYDEKLASHKNKTIPFATKLDHCQYARNHEQQLRRLPADGWNETIIRCSQRPFLERLFAIITRTIETVLHRQQLIR